MQRFFGGDLYAILKSYKLCEKSSPLEELASSTYLKRDDKLDLKCSKQRSIPIQIQYHLSNNKKNFVVSSTGNAALVSIYCALNNPEIKKMDVFFSNYGEGLSNDKIVKLEKLLNLDLSKIQKNIKNDFTYRLNDTPTGKEITIHLDKNPKQRAYQLSTKEGYVNLRGSVDDAAVLGFKTIAYEVYNQLEESVDLNSTINIFVPASSGTTALGVYEGFKELGFIPKINVVQTTKVHSLIKRIYKETYDREEVHHANSILDIIGHRRSDIESIIDVAKGEPWIISDKECVDSYKELKSLGVSTSYDSTLTYAALKKSGKINTTEKNILIFTG